MKRRGMLSSIAHKHGAAAVCKRRRPPLRLWARGQLPAYGYAEGFGEKLDLQFIYFILVPNVKLWKVSFTDLG